MTPDDPVGPRAWLRGTLLGIALGALFLGIGGRLAMWGIAVINGAPARFTLGGSATVVFLGAVWGLVGGAVFVGLRLVLRRRRLVRAAIFWLLLFLLTLRGLRPIDAQRLLLFVPLVILYGTALQLSWGRVPGKRLK